MDLKLAIIILHLHQRWRKGETIDMIEPKVITEAIDVILKYYYK